MSDANLATCADFTFGAEGGDVISRDLDDGGNWSTGLAGHGVLIGSKYGVAAPTLISWLSPEPVTAATMAALTVQTATAIFAARYWQATDCAALPGGVDLMISDMAFNAGDASSVRLLQRTVGLQGDDIDGWCGPETVAAIGKVDFPALVPGLSAMAAKAVQTHVGVVADGDIGPQSLAAIAGRPDQIFILCAALADAQLAYYRSLEAWPLYGRGWSNRVSARLTAALQLAA